MWASFLSILWLADLDSAGCPFAPQVLWDACLLWLLSLARGTVAKESIHLPLPVDIRRPYHTLHLKPALAQLGFLLLDSFWLLGGSLILESMVACTSAGALFHELTSLFSAVV